MMIGIRAYGHRFKFVYRELSFSPHITHTISRIFDVHGRSSRATGKQPCTQFSYKATQPHPGVLSSCSPEEEEEAASAVDSRFKLSFLCSTNLSKSSSLTP